MLTNTCDSIYFEKRADETDNEFKTRIIACKDDFGLTWYDVAEILNRGLGCDYSESKYRKEATRVLEENLKRKVEQKSEESEEQMSMEEVLFEIKKEKVKASDERVQTNALIRKAAREDVYKEIALDAARLVAESKPLEVPEIKKISEVEKIGILCIGDWHYGLDVDLFFNKYSPEIARKRVANLMAHVYNIIEENNLEEMYVLNLGDMISGRIHLPLRLHSRMDVVTQTMEVSELIAEMLNSFSKKIAVTYVSVEDNHSRVEPNKRDSLETESFSRIIDWYIKERLTNNPNVSFEENIIGPDIALFGVFGFNVAAVHGDRDPQRGIVDKLNSYLQSHLDMVISAHMHHFSADENNNTEFYCNGSLIGQDQYANDLRLNSRPSQLMFVATPENLTKIIYKIKL